MKLCLYQGTFNPPHIGHLQVAKFVLETLKPDKILFIPAAKPPHKSLNESKEEALHRLRMTELLIKEEKKFKISDIEFQRETPSYTCVTVKEIYKTYNLKEQPYFLIGDDAFAKIKSWYHTEELKTLVDFVVLPRDDDFEEKKFAGLKEKGYNFVRLKMPKINVSSTEIRQKVKRGQNIETLTTKEVEEYIYEHQLYKNVD